jgi:hypothetical protein
MAGRESLGARLRECTKVRWLVGQGEVRDHVPALGDAGSMPFCGKVLRSEHVDSTSSQSEKFGASELGS